MILKLDIHKAYDTVSWDFIQETLPLFGLPISVINQIMFSVSNMNTSILWNGEMLPTFVSGRSKEWESFLPTANSINLGASGCLGQNGESCS